MILCQVYTPAEEDALITANFHPWQVSVTGPQPSARENHAACMVSHYLMVSSGVQNLNGGHRRLADTHVLDTSSPSWECLDEGNWGTAVSKLPQANYCAFYGNKLYTLKPNK